jgi:hypothetical protein
MTCTGTSTAHSHDAGDRQKQKLCDNQDIVVVKFGEKRVCFKAWVHRVRKGSNPNIIHSVVK